MFVETPGASKEESAKSSYPEFSQALPTSRPELLMRAVDEAKAVHASTLGEAGEGLREDFTDLDAMVVALSVGGLREHEVARVTGFSKQRIQDTLSDPRAKHIADAVVRRIVGDAAAALRERIVMACGDAFDTIRDLLHSDDEQVRLSAAKDLMDRGGFQKRDVQNRAAVALVFDNEAAQELASVLRESNLPEQKLEFVQDSVGAIRKPRKRVIDPAILAHTGGAAHGADA